MDSLSPASPTGLVALVCQVPPRRPGWSCPSSLAFRVGKADRAGHTLRLSGCRLTVEELGHSEGQIERLASVQAGIAGAPVVVGELLVVDVV